MRLRRNCAGRAGRSIAQRSIVIGLAGRSGAPEMDGG
jgi:hypothetical protein